jgi:predicted PurR-regulated permease PerM
MGIMSNSYNNMNINISTSTLMRILLIGAGVFALIKLFNIVLIVLTSIVIASFVTSAADKLKKYIKNRTVLVFLIYVISTSLIIYLLSVFVPVFVSEMSALVASLDQYIPDSSILNTFQSDTLSGAKGVVKDITSNASLGDLINSIQGVMNSFSGTFFDIFGQAFGGAVNLLLIGIISFYLSVKEKGIENFLRIVIPNSTEEYIIDLWQRTERKIGLWVQGQMLLGVIIGLLTYLGLTILNVKYSLVLAIIAAFFELIPFGTYLALVPAVLFSYLDGGVALSFAVLALYIVLNQFENYLIYPLIIKKVIGVSPLVVILSILIGGTLIGIWGVILSVPLASILMELASDLEKRKSNNE